MSNFTLNGYDPEGEVHALQLQLKSTMMIVGILVLRLGGTVSITPQELIDIYDYRLTREDERYETKIKLTVEKNRTAPG
jgi:hypothetical protein